MALPSGVQPNTVYFGYAPASSITLQANVSGGTPPYDYNWSNGSHNASITVSPATTTTYTVSVTDATGCSSNTASKTISVIDIRGGKNNDKVVICHKPSELNSTLTIGQEGVADHLGHGDMLGACSVSASSMTDFTMVKEPLLTKSFALKSSPNPIGQRARITYSLPVEANVDIRIYDISGREVSIVARGNRTAGSYRVEINSSTLKPGLYYCRMSTVVDGQPQIQTQKLMKAE